MAKENTTVKFLHYLMHNSGGGVAATTPGAFIAWLEKVLIDGFNSRTLTSLSVANDIATGTVTAGHGFVARQVITIAGATPSSLNGEWRILTVPNATTFTFTTANISDQTATGTITAKTSPIGGWEKVYHTGNDATFRSTNVSGPRSFHRFVDSSTAQTGVAYVASSAQASYNDETFKWCGSSSTPIIFRPSHGWLIVGDDKTLYFATWKSDTCYWSAIGEFVSLKANDTQNDLGLGTVNVSAQSDYTCCVWSWFDSSGSGGAYGEQVRRSDTGLVAGIQPFITGVKSSGLNLSGWPAAVFPSPVDNGLMLADVILTEYSGGGDTGWAIRGRARGTYMVNAHQPFLSTLIAAPIPGVLIEGVSGLAGRTILLAPIPFSATNQTGSWGVVALDITGPWS